MANKKKERIRSVRFEMKMTPDERKFLHDKATYLGMKDSECAIRCILDGFIIKYDTVGIKETCNELNKIGVNINQIAKHINEHGGEYDKLEMQYMQNEFKKLSSLLIDKIMGVAE